jgi:hypothetical protein
MVMATSVGLGIILERTSKSLLKRVRVTVNRGSVGHGLMMFKICRLNGAG